VVVVPLVGLLAGCGHNGEDSPNLSKVNPGGTIIASDNQAVCNAVSTYFSYKPGDEGQGENSTADRDKTLAAQLEKYDTPNASPKLRADIPNVVHTADAPPSQYQKFETALTAIVATCSNLGYPPASP
jgi:hypothetical protein